MAIRGLKVTPSDTLTPPVTWNEGSYVLSMDIDDVTGQLYAGGLPIGTDETFPRKMVGVVVTSAQILTLRANPVQIIASPGPGYCVVVDHVLFQYKFVTTPYANTGPSDLQLEYKTSGVDFSVFNSNDLLNKTSSQLVTFDVPTIITPQSNAENQAVQWAHNGGSTEFINGDGYVGIIAYYRVFKLL